MSSKIQKKREQYFRRKQRVRARISGTKDVPRLSVYRSLQHIYAQLIDDETGVTLVASADKYLKTPAKAEEGMSKKVAAAYSVGKDLAEKAKAAGISKIVFDRGAFKYHGRVKALADGARESGLEF